MRQGNAAGELTPDMRFQFGRNWTRFLSVVDTKRIDEAVQSMQEMLGVVDLRGQSFVDVGCGSGLFSLAASRLGSAPIRSFDFDSASVACTRELKRRFSSDSADWTIEQGSVLDADYIGSLGTFDIVYSWGVLHHTGQMWLALTNAMRLVRPGGRLFIAIYNDQGRQSLIWLRIKELYNRRGRAMRMTLLLGVGVVFGARALFSKLRWVWRWSKGESSRRGPGRGMSWWYDLVDWVGGYPFEVAHPGEVIAFCGKRGFTLLRLARIGTGHGNNQFVFSHGTGSFAPVGDGAKT